MNNVKCEPKKYKHSYLRSALVLICVTAMVGDIFTLAVLRRLNLHGSKNETNVCFYVSSDIGDRWPDTCLGGVQGDCSGALGRWIVGILKESLKHWSNDAGGCPPLPHHHCHDPGREIPQLCIAVSC